MHWIFIVILRDIYDRYVNIMHVLFSADSNVTLLQAESIDIGQTTTSPIPKSTYVVEMYPIVLRTRFKSLTHLCLE